MLDFEWSNGCSEDQSEWILTNKSDKNDLNVYGYMWRDCINNLVCWAYWNLDNRWVHGEEDLPMETVRVFVLRRVEALYNPSPNYFELNPDLRFAGLI
jgi:hypothetical protein